MNNGGDVLARGGRRAQFSGPKVSQRAWDAIWADTDETEIQEEIRDEEIGNAKQQTLKRKSK